MSGTRLEIQNISEVRRYLSQLPDSMFQDARTAFQEAVFGADRKVKENCDSKLNVRTGALRRSIRTSVRGTDLDSLAASIYSAQMAGGQEVVYAPIHEFGGTIRAQRAYTGVPGGPYLNIPTRSNQTSSGVMRMPAREVFARGGFVAKTRSGKWGVFMGGQMMFVLKKEVSIPARLGMREAAEEQVPTLLTKLANMG